MTDLPPLPPGQQKLIDELEAIASRLGAGELSEAEAQAQGDEVLQRLRLQTVADVEAEMAKRLKTRRMLAAIAAVAIAGALAAILMLLPSARAAAVEPFSSSAHGEAIHLVVSTQAEVLKELDTDPGALEAVPRVWSVQRRHAGGSPDQAQAFTVSLSIDGRTVATWFVHTGEGTVERLAAPNERPVQLE